MQAETGDYYRNHAADKGIDHDRAEAFLASLSVGTRLRLRRDIDRYPHFIAKAGSVGTLVENDGDERRVRMDDHIDGAEEWDNEIHWTYEDQLYMGDDVELA